MAYTPTVISMDTEIDVLTKYNQLVTESLSGDSSYIRIKETIDQMYLDSTITGAEKAQVLSSVLSAFNTTVISTSMTTALAWAEKEKALALEKLTVEKQIDTLKQDALIGEANVAKITSDDLLAQATNLRANGVMTVVDGKVTGLTAEGKAFADTALVNAQLVNVPKEGSVLDARVAETQAGTHKIVADTFTNFGQFTYTLSDTGATNVANGTSNADQLTRLSYLQGVIAKEQAKGYTYNAWANAASGLGAAVGTIIASDSTSFGTNTYPNLLPDWESTITSLKTIPDPALLF